MAKGRAKGRPFRNKMEGDWLIQIFLERAGLDHQENGKGPGQGSPC